MTASRQLRATGPGCDPGLWRRPGGGAGCSACNAPQLRMVRCTSWSAGRLVWSASVRGSRGQHAVHSVMSSEMCCRPVNACGVRNVSYGLRSMSCTTLLIWCGVTDLPAIQGPSQAVNGQRPQLRHGVGDAMHTEAHAPAPPMQHHGVQRGHVLRKVSRCGCHRPPLFAVHRCGVHHSTDCTAPCTAHRHGSVHIGVTELRHEVVAEHIPRHATYELCAAAVVGEAAASPSRVMASVWRCGCWTTQQRGQNCSVDLVHRGVGL